MGYLLTNAQQVENLVDTHSPAATADLIPQPIVVPASFGDATTLGREQSHEPLQGRTQSSDSSESFAQTIAYFGSYFFWVVVIGLSAGILLI